MKPDRTNYELWLIDYLDGVLDSDQVIEVISFLNDNPDLRNEFEELSQQFRLDDQIFDNKERLKRSVSELPKSQFELLCVADAEGDLTAEQRSEMELILGTDPEKRKTHDLFRRLRLIPPQIKFKKKLRLRKLTGRQKIFQISAVGLSTAAGLALMLSLFNIYVKSGRELKDPVSSYTITNSNKTDSPEIASAPQIKGKENTEIIQTAGNVVYDKLIDSVNTEPQVSINKSYAPDTPAGKHENEYINIFKSDFKREVSLTKKQFAGNLLAINTQEIIQVEPPDKPGFNDFIARVFREKILRSKTPETGSIKAYEVADASINGLNKLLGWQMSLQQTRDKKGDLKSLYFSSRILKFNAPVRKSELVP